MGYGRQELAVAVAAEGLRPLLPPGDSPPGFEQLLAHCWQRDPASRPTMAMVAEALGGIGAAIPAWIQANPWQQLRRGGQDQGRQQAGGIDATWDTGLGHVDIAISSTNPLRPEGVGDDSPDAAAYRPTITAGKNGTDTISLP